jgi:hypothetical protein
METEESIIMDENPDDHVLHIEDTIIPNLSPKPQFTNYTISMAISSTHKKKKIFD